MNKLIPALLAVILLNASAVRADKLVLVAGGGAAENGPATQVKLVGPFAVGSDAAGNLYIAEFEGNRIRKITPDGNLTTIAGNGKKGFSGDDGPATSAQLNGPHHLLVTPAGDVYIADTFNNRVRKIDAKTGLITTIAGTGKKGYSGDGGPANKADMGGIFCLAVDPDWKRLYLDDLDSKRILVIDMASGVISTAAGNGMRGVPTDGSDAKASPLQDPRAVAVDTAGNIYILERGGNSVRVVDKAGKIKTVVGTGKGGNTGDGGDARKATMNGPKHLCIDLDGSVVIADAENHVIRRYTPADGKINRVAGTGKKGTGPVGEPPETTDLHRPHGVFVAPDGTLYISDSYNNRVLKLVK